MKKAGIVTLVFMLLLLFSCSGNDSGTAVSGRKSHVLVFHVYDSTFMNYQAFDRVFAKSLENKGADVEIRNIYSAGRLSYTRSDAYADPLEKMNEEGWVPDVICFFDDRTLSQYLDGTYSRWLPPMDSVPVVAAGLHCPDWTQIRQSKAELAICTDLIDFSRNVDMASRMARYTAPRGHKMYSSVVVVELDTSAYDRRVGERMATELNRPPYVVNQDLHIRNLTLDEIERRYKDSIIVTAFSNLIPEMNGIFSDDSMRHFRKAMFQTLDYVPVLTVKMDIENEQFLNMTLKPQFTAIRDGFADGLRRHLCGFFTSYETVAQDQADYVSRVLNGEKANSLPVKQHIAREYMDWEAMELLGLKYRDFEDEFVIVGAPWSERHRFQYLFLVCLAIVCLVYVPYFITHKILSLKDVRLAGAINALEQERVMMNMALEGADCIIIRSADEFLALQDRIHADDADIPAEIIGSITAGRDVSNMKFRMSSDGGATYRWWQFKIAEFLKSEGKVSGIILDVDDTVKYKENLEEAALVAEEITRKETFMMNISHEIRTPLNAILGFAQLLSADDDFSDAERAEISGLIKDNALFLGEMIEDILQFSRFESGRNDINPVETEIEPLMERVFENWSANVPEGLEFVLSRGRRHVFAVIDPFRMETVLGQYLKNAFKFTSSGMVRIGWDFSLSDGTVRLFVDDSGRGIDSRKRKMVFNIFWKDDMFKTGVGLGLTIAKLYTENMKGEVGVESIPGVGSCFYSKFRATVKQ